MLKIDKIKWGTVWVDGQKYHQVLIVGNKVLERDKKKLEKMFGTSHQIGDWEKKLLLSQDPEIILIAIGWNGVLKIDKNLESKLVQAKIELRRILTGQAGEEYRRLVAQGKRVNALIHTTC